MAKVLQRLDDNHNIFQYSDGFSFGTDAVLLAGFIKTKKDLIGVEFGTGTGIVPILLSIHKSFKHLYAIEIQEDYYNLAKENIEINNFNEKVSIIHGDFTKKIEIPEKKVDFIFSNPPYMRIDSGYKNTSEKKLIARHEVFGDVYGYAESAARLLNDKGEFYTVYRVDRLPDLIHALKKSGLEPKNMMLVSGNPGLSPKLCLIRSVKNASYGMTLHKIFYMEDKNGLRTEECNLLYEKGVIEWEKG